ncbi:MAG: MFS transporter [Candidatus Helarchaeota archaeon]
MIKIKIQYLLSFLLISIGLMTTMTFGFVPLVNIFEGYGITTIHLLFFWIPFGLACIIIGYGIDKIKEKKYFCFSYVIWGLIVTGLVYVIPNFTLTIILITTIAIITAINVIIAASYISANIQMDRRGFYTGIYLGLGWAFVAGSAYLSFLNMFLNLIILASLNIIVGLVSFLIFNSGKVKLSFEQKMIIPKEYNVKRNGFTFYFSTAVFGVFLGIIVYLLGIWTNLTDWSASIYLRYIPRYYAFVELFGFGTITTRLFLINFDFLVIGAISALICPIIGKLIDRYGRKLIFFAGNLMIPAVLVMFSFWNIDLFMYLCVLLYSFIVTVFVIINANVWSDLASEHKTAQFNGFGWSSLGLGGSAGFLLGCFVTFELTEIDIRVILAILIVSELSLIPFVLMKESLPPAEEINWRDEIIHLYVISSGGVIMSDYSFAETTITDSDLLAGGISGVTTLLKEIVGSDEQLKIIDHEDKKLLFEYDTDQQFLVALLVNKDLNILRTKLKKLTNQIHSVFWETIKKWDGNLDVLAPIKTLIRNIFEP